MILVSIVHYIYTHIRFAATIYITFYLFTYLTLLFRHSTSFLVIFHHPHYQLTRSMPAGNHRSPLQKPFSTDVRGQRFSSGPQILMAYVAYTSVLASCPLPKSAGSNQKFANCVIRMSTGSSSFMRGPRYVGRKEPSSGSWISEWMEHFPGKIVTDSLDNGREAGFCGWQRIQATTPTKQIPISSKRHHHSCASPSHE